MFGGLDESVSSTSRSPGTVVLARVGMPCPAGLTAHGAESPEIGFWDIIQEQLGKTHKDGASRAPRALGL